MSFDHGRLVDLRVVSQYVFDAVVNCAVLGANTVVTNTTTKHLVLLQYVLTCNTPGNTVTWEDSDGVIKSGAMEFSATGGLVAGESSVGQFMIDAGKSLVIRLSAAQQVSGYLSYALV